MWKFSENVRSQIAIILLLAIVPLGVLAVYRAVQERAVERERVGADLRATVQLVSQELNQVIRSSSDLVRGFSRNSRPLEEPEACSTHLASLKPAFPQFQNMAVIAPDMTLLCAASNPARVRTVPHLPENYALVERVRQTRDVVVGSFISVTTTYGKRVLPIMGPVFDAHGEIRAFFFVTVSLDWLNDQINSIAVPPGGVLLVMDKRGGEIARNPRDPRWSLGVLAPLFEQTLLGKAGFESEVIGSDGISRLYTVARVDAGEDLMVVMKIRSSTVFQSAQRRLRISLGGLAVVGLLVFGLAWAGSNRYFSRPLFRLIQAANRLAAGSLDTRSGLKYSGELGLLARSFDRMADTLEQNHKREAEAAAEKAKLQAQLNQAQKMESIGRLAGGVAHDFNNLLTVVLGYSKMLLDNAALSERAAGQVREIHKAGLRASALTQQLLAFSRQHVVTLRDLNLNDVVAEIAGMLQPMLGEDVHVTTALAKDLGSTLGDAGQMHQVVMNLAVNARDAMPKGGALRLETANVDLDERFAAAHPGLTPGPYVRLTVADSGTGIDAVTMESIFDPFFTTKPIGEGTGLGLATVHGIVSQRGGCVAVESEPGKGTTFGIYLPRTRTSATLMASLKAAEGGRSVASESILLVEDQDAVRQFTAAVLTGLGYRVKTVNCGEEALQMARQGVRIDLMITDVVMKGMSGPELAAHLEKIRPGTRVLYVSGYAENVAVRRGAPGATFQYLSKPFSPEDLAAKVREVMG